MNKNRHLSPVVRTSSYRVTGYGSAFGGRRAVVSNGGGGVLCWRRRSASAGGGTSARHVQYGRGRGRPITAGRPFFRGAISRASIYPSTRPRTNRQRRPPRQRTAPPTDRAIRSRRAGPRACARLIVGQILLIYYYIVAL